VRALFVHAVKIVSLLCVCEKKHNVLIKSSRSQTRTRTHFIIFTTSRHYPGKVYSGLLLYAAARGLFIETTGRGSCGSPLAAVPVCSLALRFPRSQSPSSSLLPSPSLLPLRLTGDSDSLFGASSAVVAAAVMETEVAAADCVTVVAAGGEERTAGAGGSPIRSRSDSAFGGEASVNGAAAARVAGIGADCPTGGARAGAVSAVLRAGVADNPIKARSDGACAEAAVSGSTDVTGVGADAAAGAALTVGGLDRLMSPRSDSACGGEALPALRRGVVVEVASSSSSDLPLSLSKPGVLTSWLAATVRRAGGCGTPLRT
jgi:hypothetical protein